VPLSNAYIRRSRSLAIERRDDDSSKGRPRSKVSERFLRCHDRISFIVIIIIIIIIIDIFKVA